MEREIKDVIKYWIEGEIETFIKVWLLVYASLCYCYLALKILPKGSLRLSSFLPVICFFLYVPLNINSVHLGGTTGFFISWLCNFKLLLLAFDQGPLSDSSLSITKFFIIACLPIKIQQKSQENSQLFTRNGHFKETPSQESAENDANVQSGKNFGQNCNFQGTPSQESVDISSGGQNGKYSNQNGHLQESPFPSCGKPALSIGIKALLFALIIRIYDYSDYIHPNIILVIYCLHIYFCLEIILAIVAGLARGLLGLELEPQFNEPYLSTSLQDFWGRRWNLTVTRILRPTVYNPTLNLSTTVLGRAWAPLPAVLATFIASGLMHELIFYYLGRVKPTWEITWFFVLHGVCLNLEICVKKVVKGRIKLPRIIGTILTVGFVMMSSFWLFFPQMLRCNSDIRAFKEYEAIGAFFKDITRLLNSTFFA